MPRVNAIIWFSRKDKNLFWSQVQNRTTEPWNQFDSRIDQCELQHPFVGGANPPCLADPWCSVSSRLSLPPQCGSCGGAPVWCWCVDCNEALCHDCVSAHRRVTVTRRHKLLDQAPPGQSPHPSLCPDAPRRRGSFRQNRLPASKRGGASSLSFFVSSVVNTPTPSALRRRA